MSVLTCDKIFLSETYFDLRIAAEGYNLLQTYQPSNQKRDERIAAEGYKLLQTDQPGNQKRDERIAAEASKLLQTDHLGNQKRGGIYILKRGEIYIF